MQIERTLTPLPPKPAPAVTVDCFHCGDACRDGVITAHNHSFCCEGCRTVYTLLHENGLDNFYHLSPKAGISQKDRANERYGWLDDQAVVEKLLEFSEGRHARIRLHLPQIHCASCIWLLENLPRLHEGFLSCYVNFPKREASLVFDRDQVSLRQAVEILSAIGYPPDLKLERLTPRTATAPETRLYLQLGIAGFAFGNIMLLSFPEYLGMQAWDSGNLPRYINLLNILLAIPVMLYSGQDYLRAAWIGIRRKDWNIDIPIALGMITLFGRSLYEIANHLGPGYLDSLAGLIFFLLTGKWFQRRTYQQLSFDRDYKSYFPVAAQRLDPQGQEQSVTLDQLNPGDEVLVRHGELIPADSRLLRGQASIDYSFVTGEAAPVHKAPGDRLFAGGRQQGEAILLVLDKRVDQSYLTRLWEESDQRRNIDASASGLAKRVGRYFTFSILAIAFVTLAYWWPHSPTLAINAFTAVLIIACPCALALAVPFTLGNALRRLARWGAYLKNTNALEELARVDTVVLDKTGTLTSSHHPEATYAGDPLDSHAQHALFALVRQSSHPLSSALAQWLRAQGIHPTALPTLTHFAEQPGQGLSAQLDGIPLRVGKRSFVEAIHPTLPPTADVYVAVGHAGGGLTFQHAYREGLAPALAALATGRMLHLLSGDNERERPFLAPLFPPRAELRFAQSPHDKLHFVQALQQQKRRVLMIGDGLNDAGALRQAEVGLVIAESANNFTPASDAIVEGRRFAQLPNLLRYARGSIRLVYVAFLLALLYNVVGLSFAVRGALSPVVAAILMPLSSVTIVAFGVAGSSLLFRRLVGKPRQ